MWGRAHLPRPAAPTGPRFAVRSRAVRHVAIVALLAAACGDGAVAVVGTLSIDPPALAIAAGADGAVTAHLADQGTPLALPGPVTWTVRDPRLATVEGDGAGGAIIRGLAQGSTVITAALGDVTATSALTVTPPRLVALTVAPPSQTVESGDCAQFTAVAAFGDGTTVTLDGAEVGWGISAQGFSEDGRGGFCPFGVRGSFTVFAGYRAQLARATLDVTQAPLTELTLFAPPVAVVDGDHVASAVASYADGAGEDVTAAAAWASSDPAVFTVAGGRVHGVALGAATLSVTFGGLTRTAELEVHAPTLVDLAVEPPSPTLGVGGHLALLVRGSYDNGATADVTAAATWSSFDDAVVTVDATGQLTGVRAGSAFVRVDVPPVSRLIAVTVTP